jgi:purine-binding chemotaxis protein CheW
MSIQRAQGADVSRRRANAHVGGDTLITSFGCVLQNPSQPQGVVAVATALHAPPSLGQRGSQATGTIQLVSFRLGDEEYGIEITKIQEIILMGEITRVPQTPSYVKGLINLRSNVIPILDLRLRFGLAETAVTDETRIMVVNIVGKTIGLIVDAVSEVLRVSQNEIAPPPPTVAGLGREYLTGLAKLEGRLLIMLDIDKLLDEECAAAADKIASGAA